MAPIVNGVRVPRLNLLFSMSTTVGTHTAERFFMSCADVTITGMEIANRLSRGVPLAAI
jgi:hypothetical protein